MWYLRDYNPIDPKVIPIRYRNSKDSSKSSGKDSKGMWFMSPTFNKS